MVIFKARDYKTQVTHRFNIDDVSWYAPYNESDYITLVVMKSGVRLLLEAESIEIDKLMAVKDMTSRDPWDRSFVPAKAPSEPELTVTDTPMTVYSPLNVSEDQPITGDVGSTIKVAKKKGRKPGRRGR